MYRHVIHTHYRQYKYKIRPLTKDGFHAQRISVYAQWQSKIGASVPLRHLVKPTIFAMLRVKQTPTTRR